MNPNAHRKMTPKGQMSNSGMGPAITHLPVHLKALFEPNAPLEYRPKIIKRKMPPYDGITAFLDQFENETPPPRVVSETPKERRERKRLERMAEADAQMVAARAQWDPHAADERKTSDAYKTLFVGRISYETTEKQLRQEFETYGPVKRVRLVEDAENKSRGIAFVEYEHESDLKAAFKHADGKKIDGRRVVVDVERGRTVRDWLPRKFGGGIGDTRKGSAAVNVKYSGREPIGVFRPGMSMRDMGPSANDRYRPSSRREDPPRDRSRSRDRGGDRSSRYGGSSGDRGGDRDRDRSDRGRERRRSRERSKSRDRHHHSSSTRGRSDRSDRHRSRSRSRERRGSRDYHRDRR